jgi:hypothetical protein
MNRKRMLHVLLMLGLLLSLAIPLNSAWADGTETLGPPSISIASGSGTVAAGTGLISQPGTINLTVPPGTIKQVLLYWEGHGNCQDVPVVDINDCRLGQQITLNGQTLTGQIIGGPTFFYNTGSGLFFSLSYRYDITSLNLVTTGANTLTLSGLSYDTPITPGFANGASVLVIYDDGSVANIGVRDGNDLAYVNFNPTLDTTVPQTFTFAAEPVQRLADLTLLVGSVQSPEYPPGGPRPTRVIVTVNGTTYYYDNQLKSGDGPTWDTLINSIVIPAGATSLTVQILSIDALNTGNLPASLSWVTAALAVKSPGFRDTGAHTIGFWQNKNGQAIITSTATTSKVCNLTPWLRTYKPFQDLSSSANCATAATYVYDVIKAANAGGSTMNPMLKAQMLATALNVYYSDPALGGNKIGAAKPIGGLTIDLTKVCLMSKTISDTCTGGTQNASAAFGGATKLTVAQMLTYAASQSDVGGKTWYKNVKATQELAKNAFDAINNRAVLIV